VSETAIGISELLAELLVLAATETAGNLKKPLFYAQWPVRAKTWNRR